MKGGSNGKKTNKKNRKKDQDALIKFVNIYGPTLKGAIFPILRSHTQLIEEVLNDTLLSIWDNISRYDSSKSSFKNWCCVVAKYRAIDGLRRELRHKDQSSEKLEVLGT